MNTVGPQGNFANGERTGTRFGPMLSYRSNCTAILWRSIRSGSMPKVTVRHANRMTGGWQS